MMQTALQPALNAADPVAPISLDPREVRFYQREGYLPLPNLLSPHAAGCLRDEVLEIVRVSRELAGPSACGKDGRPLKLVQSGQYLRGSALDGFINSGSIRSLASQLMGGEASLYLPFTAVKSGGGGGRFAFHQDNQYTRFENGLLGINIWFALCDMTPENGCLQMCPRSHLRGTLDADLEADGHRRTRIEPDDFLPVRMRAGDAIAFSRLTVHGSGENHSSQPRVAYALQYHRDDATAVWDNQPPRLLKAAHRWSTSAVEKLTPPDPKSGDGH